MEYNSSHPPLTESRLERKHRKVTVAPIELNDVETKITSFRLLRTSFVYQTKEFFNNSTLHGVRYIAESNRPFGERLMWFCFTAIGFISALVIIFSLWEKFQTNPTITGLDMDVHNQQLVFPTIVVCPIESYDINRTYDVAFNKLGNYEEESAGVFAPFLIHLPQLSYDNMGIAYQHAINITDEEKYKYEINRRSLRYLGFQIAVYCNETLDVCKYRDEMLQCCDIFHPIYSEHGFCYAFNPRYTDDINSESVNDKYHELFETDKKWSLFFTPKRESKIFVHSHLESFGWDFRPNVVWEPDFAADVLITMKQTYTTDDARQLTVAQRKCIFPNEYELEYYKGDYTFTSCMKECRIKKCIRFCGCIPPFYRPIHSVNYCKTADLKCLASHADNITDVRDCQKCELSCANTVYEIEKLSKTTADPSKPLETYVNIEYLTWPIIRYKREVLFGWVDLLVSFGGIAGLFLGFSLLSGVEIIYYFTLRTCCMLYKNRQDLYEIEEKKLSKTQEFIDLSLKLKRRTNRSKRDDEVTQVRKIDVAEVSSQVENDQIKPQTESTQNNSNHRLPMTRVAKKMQAVQNLLQANRVATSYDYAHATGAFYMP